MKASIYISVDSKSYKSSLKNYGYILEVVKNGRPSTAQGFGQCVATYHGATLEAISEALKRFDRPCRIVIHSENAFVLNSIINNLDDWAKNNFQNSHGDLANRQQWIDVYKSLRKFEAVQVKTETHEYDTWLKGEICSRRS